MGDRTLRAAVIGLGAMGANHARVYREIDGVELAAVADTDAARISGAVGTAHTYADYRRLLDEERIDLVSVAVPTSMHLDVAADVIARGIPLLVEKPLAGTLDEGRQIADLARKAGVMLTAGHIERFNPAVIELKRRVNAGELGRVFQVHARRVGPFPARVRDVGVVLDLAPHDIDVMRFLLGSEITRVHAETEQRINTDREDMLIGTLRFAEGVVGVLDVNWLTPTKIRELSVLGERGMFVVDYLARELTFYENAEVRPASDVGHAESDVGHAPSRGADDGTSAHSNVGQTTPPVATAQPAGWAAYHLKGVSEGPVHRIPIEKREPLRVELEAFVRCVRDGTPPEVSPEDALAAIEVSEALVRSAANGIAVELAPQR